MAPRIGKLNGFELFIPDSGGKAGKGRNRTGTIQVRKDGIIVKQFRFEASDLKSQEAAILKAKKWTAASKLIESLHP